LEPQNERLQEIEISFFILNCSEKN